MNSTFFFIEINYKFRLYNNNNKLLYYIDYNLEN
jgi:hypothetical protein